MPLISHGRLTKQCPAGAFKENTVLLRLQLFRLIAENKTNGAQLGSLAQPRSALLFLRLWQTSLFGGQGDSRGWGPELSFLRPRPPWHSRPGPQLQQGESPNPYPGSTPLFQGKRLRGARDGSVLGGRTAAPSSGRHITGLRRLKRLGRHSAHARGASVTLPLHQALLPARSSQASEALPRGGGGRAA